MCHARGAARRITIAELAVRPILTLAGAVLLPVAGVEFSLEFVILFINFNIFSLFCKNYYLQRCFYVITYKEGKIGIGWLWRCGNKSNWM